MNENIKKVIEEDFSKVNNKNMIDLKLSQQPRKSHYKMTLLVCFIPIMILILIPFFNKKDNIHINQKEDDIYINQINPTQAKLYIPFYDKIDDITKLNVPHININHFAIPAMLDQFSATRVYDSSHHQNIIEYRLDYYESKNGYSKRIEINFSDQRQPLRDMFFNDNGRISIINSHEIRIYGYNQSCYAIFEYKGYQFDVDAQGLNQEQFIELIKSLLES